MTSLQLANKARSLVLNNKPARLYRSIIREIPRVLMIYDIVHLGEDHVRKQIRGHFYKHKDAKDGRVVDMLLEKGYIDLEDTLLQHKQLNHLMHIIEGPLGTDTNSKRITSESTELEQFQRAV